MFQLVDEPDARCGKEAKRDHLQSKANCQDVIPKICLCLIGFRRGKPGTAGRLDQESDYIACNKSPSDEVRRQSKSAFIGETGA